MANLKIRVLVSFSILVLQKYPVVVRIFLTIVQILVRSRLLCPCLYSWQGLNRGMPLKVFDSMRRLK